MCRCTFLAIIAGLFLPVSVAAEPELGGYLNLQGRNIGGLSGIDVSEDGRQFQIITDRGDLLTGRFLRSSKERLSGASVQKMTKLSLGADFDQERKVDSEAISATVDGTVFVAFEQEHQIRRYSGQRNARIAPPTSTKKIHRNRGIEALAHDPSGRLYAILESVKSDQKFVKIYAKVPSGWQVIHKMPVVQDYTPSGADVGPDGKLYVVERARWGVGFSTLVRRLDLSSGKIEMVMKTHWGRHANTEGIAVWRDQNDSLRMIIVSDNNYIPLLGNEVMEYILPN